MQNVEFRKEIEGIEADLLILKDRSLQDKIDQQLAGMVRFNLQRGIFSITTNGAYPIPRLVIAEESDDLAILACEKNVIIALEESEVAKIAFKMLLKGVIAENLIFLCADPIGEEKAFLKYRALLEGIISAKSLIAAPANLMTPDQFATSCRKLEAQGVRVQIFGTEDLKEIGAEALLAVGRGSKHPPRMAVLEWCGGEDEPTVLVGKGICYDAGGINLKTSSLVEMKWDKAGAGVVYAVLDVLSKLRAEVHVVGILMLAENMPDGGAMRPGDIISTLGGKKVEVIDTDCEGRLVLADGLAYAQKQFTPKELIDIGTLTLETFGALGGEYGGLFCEDERLLRQLLDAGVVSGEKLWRLPLGDYFASQLESRVADLRNVGIFRYGGSSVAAEFLRAFVSPEIPWAHIDIAGTAWNIAAPEEGVSGFGIRLLVRYLAGL